jgi:hypothetical protein
MPTLVFPVESQSRVQRRVIPIAARWRTFAAITLLSIVTLWRLWPAVATTPFHRDEARWIGNSAVLREWRHPLGEKWQDEGYRNNYGTIDEVNRRRSQPPLAMYLFGIGLIVQGEGLPHTGYWIMDKDAEWNTAQGNMPSDAELHAARRTNVVVALFTVLILYAIGARLTNRLGGVMAGLAYALHPLVTDTSTRAFSDPLLVLCVVAAAGAAIWFGARPTFGRGALIGVLLGLGAATKLSPLLLATAVGAVGIAPIAWGVVSRRKVAIRSGLAFVLVPLVAGLTFFASYPYLWTDPVTHVRRMFEFRELSFDWQADVSPHARVMGLGDATRRFGVQLGERESAAGYLLSELRSRVDIGDWLWFRELDLVLAAAGWILLFVFLFRRQFPADRVMPLLVLGGQVALIAATFRLDYARYMLPLLPAIAIGIGAVAGLAWQFANGMFEARQIEQVHLEEG